ncbi:hypothetical protein KRIGEM_01355 [Komagataeibacter rhaeticus]|nr:hypothetical protein KRIGEM_01355 [Komagataeibacter rhaeticus]
MAYMEMMEIYRFHILYLMDYPGMPGQPVIICVFFKKQFDK